MASARRMKPAVAAMTAASGMGTPREPSPTYSAAASAAAVT
ncbi:hypothetical protein ACN28S_12200 [Cystobacter fuscus]